MAKEGFRPKVVLSLIPADGKFLLTRRRHPALGVEWAFPGGVTHEGETDEEAAVREAKEEVGLKVKFEKKLLERKHPNTFVTISYCFCTLADGKEVFVGQPHEIIEVAWVPAKDVLEKFTSDVHPEIRQFILSQAK